MHVLIAILLAGPLGLRTQGPLRELFLDMTGADARPIERPVIDVRWSMANTWNEFMTLVRNEQQARQELDEQADSIALRVAVPWPWARRVFTALEWKITGHSGGWSDRPIEAWHSLIGAFNYQRAINPRNQITMTYSDDGGTAFDIHSATLAFGTSPPGPRLRSSMRRSRSQPASTSSCRPVRSRQQAVRAGSTPAPASARRGPSPAGARCTACWR